MKTIAALTVAAAILACSVTASTAQTSTPRPRGDAAGFVGWLAAKDDPAGAYGGRRWKDSLFGAASAGWYWTDHLKTEVDIGTGTAASAYRVRPVVVDGFQTHQITESIFSRRTVGLSQQYQYGRNAWFHPHVAAGANLTWERRTNHVQALVVYADLPRTARIVEPARTEGPNTTVTVRPFAAAGFKAYLSPRMFFRGDLRLAFRRGSEESLLRAGFGFDF